MENTEKRKEIESLKRRLYWLDSELGKALSSISKLEDKLLDEEDQKWQMIGLNTNWLSGLSTALETRR